ncbi:intraflagellar transport protein 43, partial [Haematococcus lacustris]
TLDKGTTASPRLALFLVTPASKISNDLNRKTRLNSAAPIVPSTRQASFYLLLAPAPCGRKGRAQSKAGRGRTPCLQEIVQDPPPQAQGPSLQPSESSRSRGGPVEEEEDSATPKPPPPGTRQLGFQGGFDTDDSAPAQPSSGSVAGDKKYVGVSRRKQEQELQEKEQAARVKSKYDERAIVADIMDIPELEEEGKEDLTRVVAEAPRVRTNKVQGIEELEEEGHFNLPGNTDRDVDLTMLTSVLCSSEQVHEPDEVWDPDMLLAGVASELNREKEKGVVSEPEPIVEFQ